MAESTKRYVHPLPQRNTSFIMIGYWIYDEIVAKFLEGKDFRTDFAEYKYSDVIESISTAYTEYGDVDVQESRNGYIYKMSGFVQSGENPVIPEPEEPGETDPDPEVPVTPEKEDPDTETKE